MLWTRVILGLALFHLGLAASPASAKTLLVFPTTGEGVTALDLGSVNRLFRDAIEARSPGSTVTLSESECGKRECAVRIATAEKADEAVYSSFYKLGAKWIFSATIVEASGVNSFSQRLTAVSIEDMEAVTVRMADALVLRKTTEQAATVDNLTEKEQTLEPERRLALYQSGVAVGYLFPTGNSFQYINENSLGDPRTHSYEQVIRLSWLNNWEFRNNLSLGTDIVWNMPSTSFGADANLKYLFGRGDFTPFVGGGLGLHYVHGDNLEDDNGEAKRNSGPAVNAQAGMLMFRTYDVNVMLRGQYQAIFNSDVDHGIAADVGVTFGNKNGRNGGSSDDGNVWEYIGAGVLTLMIIGILAN